MAAKISAALVILRRKEVEAATGLDRTTIHRRVKNKTFPASVRLGPRTVGWRQSAIEEFLVDPAGYRAEG